MYLVRQLRQSLPSGADHSGAAGEGPSGAEGAAGAKEMKTVEKIGERPRRSFFFTGKRCRKNRCTLLKSENFFQGFCNISVCGPVSKRFGSCYNNQQADNGSGFLGSASACILSLGWKAYICEPCKPEQFLLALECRPSRRTCFFIPFINKRFRSEANCIVSDPGKTGAQSHCHKDGH